MLIPSSFAIHVTYTCPLACAHCCFSSSPSTMDSLKPQDILSAIRALGPEIKMVAFTGGEPFLHGKNLIEYVRTAKKSGFLTRVVTSAHFATNEESARRRLTELRNAGLDELSISWDDYHEEFVPFDRIRNAAKVSVELNILTAINSVQSAETKWTRERIEKGLGGIAEHLTIICESHLNITGRAEIQLADEKFRQNRYLGPCPYVVTGPTLSAKGKVMACCGVIPNTERLFMGDLNHLNLVDTIRSATSNPLFMWLYMRGPYALMEAMSKRYGMKVPKKDEFGGNCEACKMVLTGKEFDEKLDEFMAEKAPTILGEYLLLESLGLMDPRSIGLLWSDIGPA